MKTPNPDHPIRNTLKHLALGVAAAAAFFASGPSANAAPPVTTGLKLHLDASALTGLSDGNTVNTWTDVSGLNNHATRTSGAPTYETNELGGKPVVRFPNGGGAYFSFPNMTDIRTVFWVVKESTANMHFLLGHSSNYDFHRGEGAQIWHGNWTSNNIKNGTTRLNGPVVNGTTTTLPAGWNLVSLGTTGNVSASSLIQDRVYGRNWEGDIAEVLIYNVALSPADELLVGGYLTAKYALTTSYPTGLTVSLTSPANNEAFVSGTTPISATANVVSGTAPHTVKFFTRSLPGGTFAQAGADDTTSPYTVDLGALAVGTYEIYTTVTDSATPTPATSTSATRTFTVAPAQTTTTTVVSSGSPSIYGNSVTFTATVSPVPTGGTVQFYNGINYVGSPVAVNTTTGVATVSTTTLGVGTGEITAEYSGYQIYETSDSTAASISQVVTKAPLTVTASNSIRSINSANPTFTYQITGYKNSQTLGTSGVTGTPSLTTTATSSSPAGAYPITCALGTLAAPNYSFTLVDSTLTIVATDTPEVVTLIDSIALASPSSWGGIAVTNASSNIAVTGSGPLTLGAGGINMATSTVNLTLGAPITLGASQTWDTASGRTLEATGIISGSSMGLTKAGLGTLTLKGANTYDGTTIVNGGTLTLNRQTGSLNGSTGTELTFGGTGTFNMDNVGASGALTQNLGTLTFSAGDGTVKTTRTVAQNEVLTFASLTARAAGATGNFVHGGDTNSATNGFTLTSTTNAPLSTGSNNPGLFFGGTEYARYDAGGFFRATAYGTDTNALATVATGATIGVDDAAKDVKITGAITAQTTAAVNTLNLGANAFTLTAGNTLSVNGLLSTNTLTFGAAANQGAIQATADGGEIVVNTNAGTLTLNSVIQNFSGGSLTSALTKSGLGTLTLSGTNLYTGGTTINAGTISLATAASLGSGAVTVNNGATLQLNNVVLNRNLTLNGGTLALGAGNGAGGFSGTITLAANSNIYADGSNFNTMPFSAAISGAGGYTQNGPSIAGAVLLTNASNTYTGRTVINNGALIVKSSIYGNDTSKWTPANITVASNAVLGMSVGGAGEFTMAQAATMFTNLTTNVNNNGMRANSFMSLDTRNAPAGTYTYSAALTDSTGPGGGAVNFEFNGTSNTTLELTGANTYSGVTMVRNNATLRVSSLNSVFTNPTLGTVHSASSSLGAPTTVANGTILLGESNWNGNKMPGTTYASGNLTYTGTGETTDRVLLLGGYSGTRNYTLDQSGTGLLKFTSNISTPLIANTTHSLILAGSTAGTGEFAGVIPNNNVGYNTTLTKNGTGTWTLSGANLYSGATTVNAGTLLVNNTTGSGTGTGNVSVTAGTLGGSGAISGAVTIGNGTGTADSILAPGNSIGTIATGNLAFSSDGSYAAELNGTSVTTDVTNVTGTVTINAATTLTVNVAGTLAADQKYFIVNNDGVDAVTGTFVGRAQDAVVGNFGGTDLKISYTGNSGTSAITGGNDIVLYTDASGSPYDTWANGTFTPPLTAKLPTDNQDGDSLTNLQEFAFGTQPTGSTGEIVYSGGTLTTPGAPKLVAAAGTYSMVFGRRADYVAAGLTYTVQFSADLITWVDNNDVANPPVQVATDNTINVMSVPFVNFIDTPSGSRKPTFARVKVVQAP